MQLRLCLLAASSSRFASKSMATSRVAPAAISLGHHLAGGFAQFLAPAASPLPPLVRLFSPLHGWRSRRRERVDEGRAVAQVSTVLPTFSQQAFVSDARATYARLLAAVSSHDVHKLKELLSPAALAAVRAGFAESERSGVRQGARIVAWDLGRTGIVRTRLYTPSREAAGAVPSFSGPPPEWLHITFAAALTVEPFATRVQGGGSGGSSGGSGGTQPRARTPCFVPVSDPASGCLYWWDRTTGATTWERPRDASLATSAVLPFRLETAGCEREALPVTADGSPQLVRVLHHITFERDVRVEGNAAAAAVRPWHIIAV